MINVYLKINDLEKSQKLWRYMDLPKFVSMIDKNALWLARADTFRDRHEGRIPEVMRNIIDKVYENLDDTNKSSVKNTEDFQDYLLKNTFMCCWHKNFDENMVMWEIYGKDSNALAVQTTVENIKESIDVSKLKGHSLVMKNVRYQNPDEIKDNVLYEECFFIKRPHFSFEEEVRISLDTYNKLNPSKKAVYGHYLPAKINKLIEKILVHPDSSDWFMEVVHSITQHYGIRATVEKGTCGTK